MRNCGGALLGALSHPGVRLRCFSHPPLKSSLRLVYEEPSRCCQPQHAALLLGIEAAVRQSWQTMSQTGCLGTVQGPARGRPRYERGQKPREGREAGRPVKQRWGRSVEKEELGGPLLWVCRWEPWADPH